VYASLQLLVTISQFSKLHPSIRFSCVDYECIVLDGMTEIAVDCIQSKVSPPVKVAVFHKPSCTFEEMGIMVRYIVHV